MVVAVAVPRPLPLTMCSSVHASKRIFFFSRRRRFHLCSSPVKKELREGRVPPPVGIERRVLRFFSLSLSLDRAPAWTMPLWLIGLGVAQTLTHAVKVCLLLPNCIRVGEECGIRRSWFLLVSTSHSFRLLVLTYFGLLSSPPFPIPLLSCA